MLNSGDYRERAWRQFLSALTLATAPAWLLPAATAFLVGLPLHLAVLLTMFSLGHVVVWRMLRANLALNTAMLVFGALCFAGVTVAGVILGGFRFEILLFTITLPAAVVVQRKRAMARFWIVACVLQYVVWFAMTRSSHAPAAAFELGAHGTMVMRICALASWIGLLLIISRSSATVTYAFFEERNSYQHAVLQAQKLDALGKLAGGIENSFNNTLMSMDYSVHLLSKSVRDAALREEVRELEATLERCKALSRKLERLGPNPTIELIAVDEAIEALGRMLRRLVHDRVAVNITLGAPNVYVRCDAGQLDQVLVNLVVNASDAMPEGGTIEVRTRQVGDRIYIEVADTGVGIDAKVLPHIFEPFFTTKSSTKSRDSGSGLGLWICRSIAESCGGTLTATSALGAGSVMRVDLPFTDPADTSARIRRITSQPIEVRKPTPAVRARQWFGQQALGWFVDGVAVTRQRTWATYFVMSVFASVPFWIGSGFLHVAYFGMGPSAALMFFGAIGSTLALFHLKRSGKLLPSVVATGLIVLVSLTGAALVRGGIHVPTLAWLALIPAAAAQQREHRYLARACTALVLLAYAAVAICALTGVTPARELPPSHADVETLLVLLALLAMTLALFGAMALTTERFALERDSYEATLVRSRDAETLGAFAGSIAHDLNNVLMTLEFGTAALADGLPPAGPHRADIAELQTGARRIRDIARQLTGFGRTANAAAERVNPAETLAEVEPLLRTIVGSHVEIRMNLAESAPVELSKNALDQLIVNLALNARDAMPDGGVLEIATSSTGDNVEIAIRDTGVGIAPDVIGKVCEPFFTTDDGHVGLGLWVCRELVDNASGNLQVESQLGSGTTVRVRLPHVKVSRTKTPRTRPREITQEHR